MIGINGVWLHSRILWVGMQRIDTLVASCPDVRPPLSLYTHCLNPTSSLVFYNLHQSATVFTRAIRAWRTGHPCIFLPLCFPPIPFSSAVHLRSAFVCLLSAVQLAFQMVPSLSTKVKLRTPIPPPSPSVWSLSADNIIKQYLFLLHTSVLLCYLVWLFFTGCVHFIQSIHYFYYTIHCLVTMLWPLVVHLPHLQQQGVTKHKYCYL